jgi:RNA-binding protein 48
LQRFAKRKLDATSFYGGVLHICYAPEMETVEEVKEKLEARKKDVYKRLNPNFKRCVTQTIKILTKMSFANLILETRII